MGSNKETLTQRQANFARFLFQGMTQREAWGAAGYSTGYALSIVDKHACELANLGKVKGRLAELRAQADSEAIADVIERKKVLTEIVRGRFGDFADETGNLDIQSKAKLKNAALQEIKTERTLVGVRTTVKLRDPVVAIDLLNKMDKLYSDNAPPGDQVVNNFLFVLPDGTKLTPKQLAYVKNSEAKQIVEGEVIDNNGDKGD